MNDRERFPPSPPLRVRIIRGSATSRDELSRFVQGLERLRAAGRLGAFVTASEDDGEAVTFHVIPVLDENGEVASCDPKGFAQNLLALEDGYRSMVSARLSLNPPSPDAHPLEADPELASELSARLKRRLV